MTPASKAHSPDRKSEAPRAEADFVIDALRRRGAHSLRKFGSPGKKVMRKDMFRLRRLKRQLAIAVRADAGEWFGHIGRYRYGRRCIGF